MRDHLGLRFVILIIIGAGAARDFLNFEFLRAVGFLLDEKVADLGLELRLIRLVTEVVETVGSLIILVPVAFLATVVLFSIAIAISLGRSLLREVLYARLEGALMLPRRSFAAILIDGSQNLVLAYFLELGGIAGLGVLIGKGARRLLNGTQLLARVSVESIVIENAVVEQLIVLLLGVMPLALVVLLCERHILVSVVVVICSLVLM